ncbi:MAG: hypothetical protein R3D78_05425 [Paracoccaceae bacterium]|jgi:hypothetical protein
MHHADHQHNDDELPRWLVWGGVAVLAVALPALFFLTWKSQFAAPPGYLFGTPTQPIEAGYCLAVAQDVSPGGAPPGSYFEEAARFWVQRLRDYGAPMGDAVAKGRGRLGADLAAFKGPDQAWLREALEACSNRAVNYGARFRAFN